MSSLQQQLRAATQGASKSSDRYKASILFSAKDAPGVDVLHQIARNGLMELQRMDERFAPYAETLFADSTKSVNREAMDKAAEKKVDDSVHAFLLLLSQFMLLRPAHKVLEYLIRVYRVNEFNKDALLLAVLPYHVTRTFGLVVRLCLGRSANGTARSKPHWKVLEGSRKKGMPVDRATLVTFCSTPAGLSLLADVAAYLQKCCRHRVHSKCVRVSKPQCCAAVLELGMPFHKSH